MIARLVATLRGLVRRRQIEGEIAEELRDHLERGIDGQELVVRSSGRGSTRAVSSLRRALTIAEIAVAMVLLPGAGLMVQSMLQLGASIRGSIRTTCRPRCFRCPAQAGLTPGNRRFTTPRSSACAGCRAWRAPR